jgi:hypothetical protein
MNTRALTSPLAAPDDKQFRELELKVASLSAEGEAEGAEAARKALWATQQALDTRAAELAALERERKFNADEMCYVAKEKSLVGRQALQQQRATGCACRAGAQRG